MAHEGTVDKVPDKLQLIKSPVVKEYEVDPDNSSTYRPRISADLEGLGYRDDPDHAPSFQKVRHESVRSRSCHAYDNLAR
jgi:hypothetical protein